MPTTTEQVVHGRGVSPGLVCAPRLAFGAMIEIPSAAPRARDLLEHLDFVSIGTNDLSQYTCAVLDPWQPAVLDLIGTVGAAGAEAGPPVGVCGEAASDLALAPGASR